mmetsp:Transcript_36779/g.106078  ORF Transcript_36779/g.106078 Transcript_36779/m.106078 type:complete len:278 (-) Transcript_36779:6-839(-)
MGNPFHRNAVQSTCECKVQLPTSNIDPRHRALGQPRGFRQALQQLVRLEATALGSLPENVNMQRGTLHVFLQSLEARETMKRAVFGEQEHAQSRHRSGRRHGRIRLMSQAFAPGFHYTKRMGIFRLHCEDRASILQGFVRLAKRIQGDHAPQQRLDVRRLLLDHLRCVLDNLVMLLQLRITSGAIVGACQRQLTHRVAQLERLRITRRCLAPILSTISSVSGTFPTFCVHGPLLCGTLHDAAAATRATLRRNQRRQRLRWGAHSGAHRNGAGPAAAM